MRSLEEKLALTEAAGQKAAQTHQEEAETAREAARSASGIAKQLSDARSANTKLREEVSQLKAARKGLENSLEEASTGAVRQQAAFQKEKDAFETRLLAADSSGRDGHAVLEATVVELRCHLERQANAAQEAATAAHVSHKAEIATVQALKREQIRLELELASRTDAVAGLERLASEWEEKAAMLASEIDGRQAKRREWEAYGKEWEEKAIASQNELTRLQGSLVEHESIVAERGNELEESTEREAGLKARLSERDAEAASWELQMEGMGLKLQEISASHAEAELGSSQRLSQMEEALDESQCCKEELANELETLQKQHRALEKHLEQEKTRASQALAAWEVEREFLVSEVKHAMGQVAEIQRGKGVPDLKGALGLNAASRGGFIFPPEDAPAADGTRRLLGSRAGPLGSTGKNKAKPTQSRVKSKLSSTLKAVRSLKAA